MWNTLYQTKLHHFHNKAAYQPEKHNDIWSMKYSMLLTTLLTLPRSGECYDHYNCIHINTQTVDITSQFIITTIIIVKFLVCQLLKETELVQTTPNPLTVGGGLWKLDGPNWYWKTAYLYKRATWKRKRPTQGPTEVNFKQGGRPKNFRLRTYSCSPTWK